MRPFAIFVIVIVAVAIVAGFFVVGSPAEKRSRDFDDRRIADLQGIQGNLVQYWQGKRKLPSNLAELADPLRYVTVPVDPETKEQYGYEIRGTETFALCATFNFPSGDKNARNDYLYDAKPQAYYGTGFDVWEHGAGRICFERTIDKDFFESKPPAPIPLR